MEFLDKGVYEVIKEYLDQIMVYRMLMIFRIFL